MAKPLRELIELITVIVELCLFEIIFVIPSDFTTLNCRILRLSAVYLFTYSSISYLFIYVHVCIQVIKGDSECKDCIYVYIP